VRRYKNGRTVYSADDLRVLSRTFDPTDTPLTEGQRALLEAIASTPENTPTEQPRGERHEHQH
jgi:hypothetical protein